MAASASTGPQAAWREAVQRPTGEASGLPNALYTDPVCFEAERDRLFARTWACVGFASDVPERSSVGPIRFMGLPLFLVRDRDGVLRVFHNVCSHRGFCLVAEAGPVTGAIRCPYHSWTYALDGTLRGTPHVGGTGVHEVQGFDRSRHGLREVRSRVWFGLVFVNLSGDAVPFEEHMAPLWDRWRRFLTPEDMDARFRPATGGSGVEFRPKANWKLLVENHSDTYHLPWVHPGLNSYSRLEDHCLIQGGDLFSGAASTAYNLCETLGVDLPRIAGWPARELRHAEYASLYPNVLIGIHADHAWAVHVEPIAPDLSRERMQICYVGDAADDPGLDGVRGSIREAWREVFAEDLFAVEGMQQGRHSPAFAGGVFTPVMDTGTHHFHRWVASRLD